MIIIDVNAKPHKLETCKVYVPDGYKLSESYATELPDGTLTPIDLTTVLPITYIVSPYKGKTVVQKTLPAGETAADGLTISGANNDVLTINVPAANLEGATMITHRHYLLVTLPNKQDVAWLGDIQFKNLFSS